MSFETLVLIFVREPFARYSHIWCASAVGQIRADWQAVTGLDRAAFELAWETLGRKAGH